MPDVVVEPAAEVKTETLADYIRSENAREQREARGELDPAPVESTPAPPTTADAAPSADETAAPQESVEPDAEEREALKKGGAKRSLQAKIDLSIARQRDAERRAEAAEARARDLEAQLTPAQPSAAPTAPGSPAKPKIDDFLNEADPYAALAEAIADWKVEQRLSSYEAKQAEAKAADEFHGRMHEIHETGVAQYPDWDAAMTSDFAKTFHPPEHLYQAILQSDSSAEALYYLCTHEAEARQMANMPPLAAALALGRALTPASAAPPGPAIRDAVSRAKPPIKPVGASPVAPDSSPPDPSKTSQAEWNRYYNAEDRRKRQAARGA